MVLSMKPEALFTEFAPAERSSAEEIARQVELVAHLAGLHLVLELMPGVVLILNQNRQIVFANQNGCMLLEAEGSKEIFGLRPGELLDCEHASERPGGCGTTQSCSTCGAVKAIQNALNNRKDVQECRVIQKKTGNAIDLRIWSSPIEIENRVYDLFVANDISNEKRRYILERLFFHDILNTVSGIYSFAEILEDAHGEDEKEFKNRISSLTLRLIDEINSQRDLMKAESNELAVHIKTLNTYQLLSELANLYRQNEVAKGKYIVVDSQTESLEIETDGVLLSRILGNLLKNALEASDEGDTVTLGCRKIDGQAQFQVHNPVYILPEIQLQIFQRSFSTKGSGRGLGTYSIRLFSERYLKGKVSFTSNPQEGTTFRVQYPLLWPG
jgi:signal transduction histidine kinase